MFSFLLTSLQPSVCPPQKIPGDRPEHGRRRREICVFTLAALPSLSPPVSETSHRAYPFLPIFQIAASLSVMSLVR